MFDPVDLGTFMAVVPGAFLVPGPAVLIVLSRTAQCGRSTGIVTGLGVAAGDFIHTLGAAMGLSAVLMTSALAFNLIKYAGVAYLLYLGVRAFMEKPGALAAIPKSRAIGRKTAFFQAIAIEVLNPKTALFFLAFLPQFVHPERGAVFGQFAVLGLIFVGMGICYTTLLALSVRPLGHLFGKLAWLGRWQGKILGTMFIALGVRLALQER